MYEAPKFNVSMSLMKTTTKIGPGTDPSGIPWSIMRAETYAVETN